jgi:hypothetical protein
MALDTDIDASAAPIANKDAAIILMSIPFSKDCGEK